MVAHCKLKVSRFKNVYKFCLCSSIYIVIDIAYMFTMFELTFLSRKNKTKLLKVHLKLSLKMKFSSFKYYRVPYTTTRLICIYTRTRENLYNISVEYDAWICGLDVIHIASCQCPHSPPFSRLV